MQSIEEICFVRNEVLLGSTTFRFNRVEDLRLKQHSDAYVDPNSNFVLSHGKPSAVYLVSCLDIFSDVKI